ncbi:hypothetical protein DXG01_007355 [Tephrocybe rancida]|nr:hypothetical protein DXG01_007355 [Tephrocybe rancida]
MHDFDYFRQTRSKTVFSPWCGALVSASQNFCFEVALSTCVDASMAAFWEWDCIFGDSPLSLSCKNREKKCQQHKLNTMYGFYEERLPVQQKYPKQFGTGGIQVNLDFKDASAASSAYIGALQHFSKRTLTLEEVIRRTGFPVHSWDGETPTPIMDNNSCIVAHLAGHPEDSNWPGIHEEAAWLLKQNQHKIKEDKTLQATPYQYPVRRLRDQVPAQPHGRTQTINGKTHFL